MSGALRGVGVRRSQLRSVSPTADRDLQHLFLERLPVTYEYTSVAQEADVPAAEDSKGELQEEELEFRLFATSAKEFQAPVARVRLEPSVGKETSPGVIRGRPDSYYFKGEPSVKEQAQLTSVALSGEQVMQRAKMPTPGFSLSCRLTKILPQTSPNFATPLSKEPGRIETWLDQVTSEFEGKKKKKRPGKKSRLAARKKLEKEADHARLAKIAETDKELAERMKKSKKNRDKKLRQRAKEKEKKAAARAQQPDDEDGGAD